MCARFRRVRGRGLLTGAVFAAAVGVVLLAGCGGGDGGGVVVDSGNPGNGGNTVIVKNTDSGIEIIKNGDTITWMKKNLDVKIGSGSWCYENDSFDKDTNNYYCAEYGRLYTWEAAKSACPLFGPGWRLPARADWDNLAVAVGGKSVAGKKLKSTSGWNESSNRADEYGFSALPGGYRDSCDRDSCARDSVTGRPIRGGHYYIGAGDHGRWWSAGEGGTGNAYRWDIDRYDDCLYERASVKRHAYSVRCVRD